MSRSQIVTRELIYRLADEYELPVLAVADAVGDKALWLENNLWWLFSPGLVKGETAMLISCQVCGRKFELHGSTSTKVCSPECATRQWRMGYARNKFAGRAESEEAYKRDAEHLTKLVYYGQVSNKRSVWKLLAAILFFAALLVGAWFWPIRP